MNKREQISSICWTTSSQMSHGFILSIVSGSDASYRVTLKPNTYRWFTGTWNTLYIKVTKPYFSTNEAKMYGIDDFSKSVTVYGDVGLSSCVTVRNPGGNEVLISWVRNEITSIVE